MCGLAGYVGTDPRLGEQLLRRMASAQAHRGPDGEGFDIEPGFGLAHRRLVVIDRSGGAQPMRSPDGRYVLVYNGEVYNYRELRTELASLGWAFRSAGDTEVVLAAWAEWGIGAFDRFDGMFALAIGDTVTGEVVLARDQFGIKPLYLAVPSPGNVLFASEIRPILATGLLTPAADDTAVYRYLRFRVHDDTERTFFAGISRLLPGHVAIIGPDGSVRQRTYTSLYTDLRKLADRPQPYDRAAKARFAAELGEAVSTRLVSDVPVGTALSGGIDSSTVVATVSRLLRERDRSTSAVGAVQQAFSAVFPGEVNDEERYVDAMAAHCPALEVRKVEPNVTGFLRDMTDFVRSQEEPVVSTGPYAQYCVMRRASQRITVMLDGQGADEMLAGYLPYYAVYARQQLARGRAVRAFGGLALAADAMWRLVRPRLRDAVRRRSGLPVTALLGRDFVSAHAGERFDVVRDNLKARLEDDLFRHSIPALLRYEDRNTMRFSIEGRVPFLRSSLLRTLWALDDAAIVSGGWNKRALRDATRRSLPRVVNQRRSKIGFTTPEDAWFLRMAGPISTVFASDSFAARRYFDAPAVRRAFRLFAQGAANTETMTFWRIFNVELWLREFIDAPAVAAPGASGAMAPPGRTP